MKNIRFGAPNRLTANTTHNKKNDDYIYSLHEFPHEMHSTTCRHIHTCHSLSLLMKKSFELFRKCAQNTSSKVWPKLNITTQNEHDKKQPVDKTTIDVLETWCPMSMIHNQIYFNIATQWKTDTHILVKLDGAACTWSSGFSLNPCNFVSPNA